MRLLLLIATSAVATAASSIEEVAFSRYASNFGKRYESNSERQVAFGCWRENLAKARLFNLAEKGTARFGETSESDLCWSAFKAQRLMGTPPPKPRKTRPLQPEAAAEALHILRANPSVDWREKGALNPIQDQGRCGSCWAFGSVANIESQHFLWGANKSSEKNGTLIKLSEQELVSCDHYKDKSGADNGCQGGWPDRAFHWTIQQGGLTREANYPYTSGQGQVAQCDTSKETGPKINIFSLQDLGANETCARARRPARRPLHVHTPPCGSARAGPLTGRYVAAYVAKYGPVVIGLDATQQWQSYKGGVLTQGCDATKADHAVVIVGYGTDSSAGDYWIIRNSWNTKWGEDGYIRLKRGTNCKHVHGESNSGVSMRVRMRVLSSMRVPVCCVAQWRGEPRLHLPDVQPLPVPAGVLVHGAVLHGRLLPTGQLTRMLRDGLL